MASKTFVIHPGCVTRYDGDLMKRGMYFAPAEVGTYDMELARKLHKAGILIPKAVRAELEREDSDA